MQPVNRLILSLRSKCNIKDVRIPKLPQKTETYTRLRYMSTHRSSDRGQDQPKKAVKVEPEQEYIDLIAEKVIPDESRINDEAIFDREFIEKSIDDFKKYYENDPDGSIKAQIETILGEYESTKYNSMGRVPSELDDEIMERLLETKVTSSRLRLLDYFFKREMSKIASKKRRLRQAAEKEKRTHTGTNRTGLLDDDGNIVYGLWHNSLFSRIPEGRLKSGTSTTRLIDAARFGRKLVFDFGYHDEMRPQYNHNAQEQVMHSYGLNKHNYRKPFDLWFCNFNPETSGKLLSTKLMPHMYQPENMITMKEDCFTNHFDMSRLVYLSPHARNKCNFKEESDDVYVIGVFNDKSSGRPVSYRKARSLGIRAESLPLDQYLSWGCGAKSLCINHVVGILLELLNNGGDWQAALKRAIPSRKIKPTEVLLAEHEYRLSKKRVRDRFNVRSIEFE